MSPASVSPASVSPDPAGRGGFALLRVPDAAACHADPKFRLQRQDERAPYLGAQGWQPAEIELTPVRAWAEGADLMLELGPEVVDAVEEGTVGFSLPAGGLSLTLIWPALAPSRRGGQNVFQEGGKPEKPDPAIAALAVQNKQVSTATNTRAQQTSPLSQPLPPEPAPPRREEDQTAPRPRYLFYSVFGGGILVLAALSYLALHSRQPKPVAFQPGFAYPAASSAASPAPQPASDQSCDNKSYPVVLQCEKNPARLFVIARNLADAGSMQAAVTVYQLAAAGGYGPAALALAELYDPAHFESNSAIAQPDPRQAAHYYKLAVSDGDRDAAAPRADLYARLQQAESQGDMQAPLLLSDYWP